MPLGKEVGLGPGDVVLDGAPASHSPERGTAAPLLLSLCLLCLNSCPSQLLLSSGLLLLWPPYVNAIGRPLYFCIVVSFLFLLFSSPVLSSRRLDVYHTSTHGVAVVWFIMQVRNVLHAARWKYRTQKWRKKSPSAHHCTSLSDCIFATKECVDKWNKTC